MRVQDSTPTALVRLFRMVNRTYNRALKPMGLSAEQTHILSVLWLEGPMTIGELQRVLALSSSTLTGAIDRMEKLDLVRRVAVPGDRRAWQLEPGVMPARKRKKIEQILAETEEVCFAGLNARERSQLLALLQKAAGALE